MKILEAQSATLTNYEVYTHLKNQRARYEARGKKRRGPGNLETVVKELLDYFNEPPSPLASTPFTYNANTIKTLLVRLRSYELTKAEILMIMNLRPTQTSLLNVIIEEMEQRFEERHQEEIVNIIAQVLGRPDGEAERQAMQNSAKDARERQNDVSMEMGEETVS